MTDNRNRGEQAATDLAQGWIATMQSMADQIQRQQQTFQQMMQELMNSYVQLLNTPPFYLYQQSQEGQQAAQRGFQQASQQWMEGYHLTKTEHLKWGGTGYTETGTWRGKELCRHHLK